MALSFIVIDDSELDCFIARKIISHADKGLTVKTFQRGNEALDMVRKNMADYAESDMTIILLDLQMPMMNGFQFVEEFEKFSSEARKKFRIVILSSTRNSNDIFRIFTYNTVHSLMEKPLTLEKLLSLMQQVGAIRVD